MSFKIRLLKTENDYQEAVAEVDRLFEIERTQADEDMLELLAMLIEAYDQKHHPIGPPDPIGAIEYEMEKRGLTRSDLEPLIGHSGRVSEILNRQRRLTINMIRNLHHAYGIPADILMADYPLARDQAVEANDLTVDDVEIGSERLSAY